MGYNNINFLMMCVFEVICFKFEGGKSFVMQFEFQLVGDQFIVIVELLQGVVVGECDQVLLGVIGIGKIYIMVKVIEVMQCLVIIFVLNKMLVV